MGSKLLRPLAFGHRGEAVREALTSYSRDIQRIKTCLYSAGYEASEEDVAAAWLFHSQRSAASWLSLPNDNQELLAALLNGKYPPLVSASIPTHCWVVPIVEAGDGSGDQIVELPADLLSTSGWTIDDVLELSRLDSGEVRLRKRSAT